MTTVSLDHDAKIVQKIIDFPYQLAKASALLMGNSTLLPKKRFSNIVILGMGGSGIAGDIARTLARKSPIPVTVCKNSAPSFVNDGSLIIAITYSGKTQETLDALKVSISKGGTPLVVTSSEELDLFCSERNIPCTLIPRNGFPRASLGYMLVPVLHVFQDIGILSSIEDDVSEAIATLHEIRQEYCSSSYPRANNLAARIADALVAGDRFPIIYGECNFTDVTAQRWKQQLNENSKIHCHCDAFPELLHNEIEAWDSDGANSRVLIMLRDAIHEGEIGIKENVEVAKDLIKRNGTKVFELWTKGESELARLLSLIYVGDLVSINLAIGRGIDPSAVPNIEHMKKQRGSP